MPWAFAVVMALTFAALAVAAVMIVFGLMGSAGLLRYVHCADCGRWTRESPEGNRCVHCRWHEHVPHMHLPHLTAHT